MSSCLWRFIVVTEVGVQGKYTKIIMIIDIETLEAAGKFAIIQIYNETVGACKST